MATFSGSAADMLKSMGAAVPEQLPQTDLETSRQRPVAVTIFERF